MRDFSKMSLLNKFLKLEKGENFLGLVFLKAYFQVPMHPNFFSF